ncbi:hypothetical protein HOC32_05585 [Candidatus Woesearchaeota archaeon]|jgi:hypothetical protein|nr:hypothetical protein [Candidatus Woesearchaeota archaeon]
MADEIFGDEVVTQPQEPMVKPEPVKPKPQVRAKPKRQVKSSKTKPVSKPKRHIVKDEYVFTFHPRKLLKFSFLIILLMAVFFVGRVTAPIDGGDSFLTGLFVSDGVDEPAEIEIDAEIEETLVDEPVVAEETTTDELTAAAVIEEEPEEEVVEQKVVTTYTNTKVTVDDLYIDWKETWGKITGVDFTITNGESGIVKPNYVEISLEAYEDRLVTSVLKTTYSSINGGENMSGDVAISGGYSYSSANVDDLSNAVIVFSVFDSSGKLIATQRKAMDLNG